MMTNVGNRKTGTSCSRLCGELAVRPVRGAWLVSACLALGVGLAVTETALGTRGDVKPSPQKTAPKPVDPDQAKRVGALSGQPEQPAAPALDPNAPRPVITCKDPIHDFGTVWVGPTITHAFTVKNEGTAPLHISKVQPSCGCTVAGTYPQTIEPGGSGEFPFQLMTPKVRDKFDKAVTIMTDDPQNPSFRVRLRGEIKQYVDIVPPNAHFGNLAGDETVTRVLKLMNNTDTPLELKVKNRPKGNFDVALTETTPGKAYELTVTAKPPFAPGAFREKLELATNIEEYKAVNIDVRGSVPQRLEVYPTALNVSPDQIGTPGENRTVPKVVRLTNYGSEPVSLLEATVDDPAVAVNVIEQNAGKAYMIRVEMPAGYMPPPEGRTLTLKTNDPIKPQITVPIRALAAQDKPKQDQPEQAKKPAEELVNRPVPAFSAKTLEGKPLSSGGLAGNVTVLDFFAVNCGFCKKQIPRLESIRKEYQDKGVRFVAVSQTMRDTKFTDEQVVDKIKELGFRGELATDPDNQIGRVFQAMSFPTMVVVGKSGTVDAVNVGNMADLEARLRGQLDALLAGKPVPQPETTAQTPPAKTPPAKEAQRPGDLFGKPAPAFALETLDGKALSNATLGQHPATVVDFVATNCGYCKKQIPRLEKLRSQYAEKGVRFVNVVEAMGTKPTADDARAKMNELGWQGEVANDPDNKVGPLFNATGFPTMVVLGKNGNVEAANVGNLENLEERVTGQLDAILAGKPVPAIAVAPPPTPTPDPKTPPKAPEPSGPSPAPAFSLTTLDGKPVSNENLKNYKATVLNVVAGDCGYCKTQIPRLEKIRQQYADKGVRFVNVVGQMRKEFSADDVVAMMNELGSKLETAHDPQNTLGRVLNVRSFPTMFVLGSTGNIETSNMGNIDDLETRVPAQLDAILAGKPVPVIAQAAPATPPQSRPEDVVGKPAAEFAIQTLDGKPVSRTSLGEHPATVLNFVATNCGYCGKQIPRLQKIQEQYATKGVRFVNVVETMRQKGSVEEVVAKMTELGWKAEVAHDPDNQVGPLFNARGFPTMVVLSKSGKVEAVNVGNIEDLETRLTGQLDAILAGKSVPTIAAAPPQPQQPQRRPAEEMVGQMAPAFTATTLDGKTISNADLKSHPAVVLNFVAPNCGYCKKQVPTVEKIRQEYEAKGVRFVNVVQEMRQEFTEEQIVEVFKGVGSNIELATSDFKAKAIGGSFKAGSFPTLVVLGPDGKIANVTVGAKQDLETTLKAQLDTMIKAKP